MDPWLQSFCAGLETPGLLDGVRRLLVAVSGGPDSVCLLELLHEWARAAGEPPELLVGHVHHGLRGIEADRDADFVARLAKERGLEFLCRRGDARAVAAAERMSLEAAARRVRYRAFREWGRDRGVDGIALAHHYDDQAETVLLRAIRGSGLKGLGGIPRRRSLLDEGDPAGRGRSVVIVRPLLGWRRAEILEFLAERGLAARRDSTNADTSIPRNRVRADVLPALEKTQPGATASLVRLGELARRAHEDLRDLGERAFGEARIDAGAGWVSFDASALARWPLSVLYEVIAQARASVEGSLAGGSDGRLSSDAPPPGRLAPRPFERLAGDLKTLCAGGGHAARVIELDSGVEAELRYGRLSVRVRRPSPGGEPAESVLLCPAGREVTAAARWEGWEFSFNRHDLSADHRSAAFPGIAAADAASVPRPSRSAGACRERFDLDVLESMGPLHVRGRREGDVFHPLGAPGRKKLKEFFRECEIEPYRRPGVPLLVSGETIQWVVGCRIGHLARCRPGTRRVLEVSARFGRTGRRPLAP